MAHEAENNAQTSVGEDLTPEKDGGVLKVVKRPGSGEHGPKAGDTVYVHYVGTLAENGDKFDSSRDRGEEFSFTLGRGQVIKAWDLGVASMMKGELATLTCRADYAYGDGGSPPKIPGGATLLFEVELIRWTGEDISPDKDGSITKSTIVQGEKYAAPSDGAPVTVHAIGSHNGRVFLDKEVKFSLGECSEVGLPDGVDKALKRFNKGEKAMVHLKTPQFTYAKQPPAQYSLPADAELDFELTLKDFEKVKASWEMDHEEKLTAAAEAKERGTKFFSEGKMRLAIDKYKKVVDLLEHEKSLEAEQKTRRDALITAAYLNMALVYLKEGETVACVEQCDKALEITPDNVKAIYRRAQARQEQNDDDLAIQDFKRVLELEPSNKAAQQGINVSQHKLAEFKRTEKQKFARMFDKFAAKDHKADQERSEEARSKAFPDTGKPSENIEGAHENGSAADENGDDHDMAVPSTSEGH